MQIAAVLHATPLLSFSTCIEVLTNSRPDLGIVGRMGHYLAMKAAHRTTGMVLPRF